MKLCQKMGGLLYATQDLYEAAAELLELRPAGRKVTHLALSYYGLVPMSLRPPALFETPEAERSAAAATTSTSTRRTRPFAREGRGRILLCGRVQPMSEEPSELRPPLEVLQEQLSLAAAALTSRGLEVKTTASEARAGPFGQLLVRRSPASGLRLESPVGVEPVLDRFGFRVEGYSLSADGGTLQVLFVVRKERDWSHLQDRRMALMAERLSLAVAEVVALGIEVTEADLIEEGAGTFAVLMPGPLGYGAAMVRLQDIEPVLARHNFHIDRLQDEGPDLQIRLELSDELDWRREHPSPKTLIEQRLPLVVDELSSLGGDVTKAVSADRDGRTVGILELRRRTSSRLGLDHPTGLEPELDRYGLRVVEVEHVRVGGQARLRIRLHLHDELDWTHRTPLTAEIVAGRLAEVAAAFSASGVEVIRSHIGHGKEGSRGHLLLDGWSQLDQPLRLRTQRFGLAPERLGNLEAVFKLSFDHNGWTLRGSRSSALTFELMDIRLPQQLPVSLGAPATTVVDETLRFLLHEPSESVAAWAAPDWVTIAGTAAVTSVIVPFVQAIAGKAADDSYAVLLHLFHRLVDRHTVERLSRTAPRLGTAKRVPAHVVIRDPDTETVLVMPNPPPNAAIRKLVGLHPKRIRGQILIWDGKAEVWRPIDDLPSPSR